MARHRAYKRKKGRNTELMCDNRRGEQDHKKGKRRDNMMKIK